MSDRCERHGVTRCMLCKLKETSAATPPVELDAQAAEAAARLADTSPVDVDFGDVEIAWNSEAGKQAIDSAIIETAPHVEELAKGIISGKEGLFSPAPPLKVAPKGTHLAGNPIVDAAAAYASAQEKVANFATQHAELSAQVRELEQLIKDAQEDRDLKKQVLQALVGGAS
jgi:hypothetical protein